MMRTISGLCAAGVISCAISLTAQAPPSATTTQRTPVSDAAQHDITVTGCVAKSADGKFTLTNVVVEPASTTASGSTATTGGTAAGTTGGTAAGTTGTAPAPATSPTTVGTTVASAPTLWMLSGGTDLDKHVGHKITVMGRTAWDASMAGKPISGTGTTGTAGATTGAATAASTTSSGPSVDVRTIKMLTASCP